MNETARPLRVFISYSHRDDAWREKLERHLSLLKRQGIFDVWHDQRLVGGEDWAHSIAEELNGADIVLLLVSADFIASDYCFGLEMKTALERESRGEARVVPVIVRPCDWHSAAFAECQALPADGEPVATHPDGEDQAFTKVAQSLRKLAKELTDTHSSAAIGRRAEIYRPRPWWQRHLRALVAAGVVGLLLVALAAGSAFTKSREQLRQGERDVRLGAYERAAERFAAAARWNPFSSDARWGARLASLGTMIGDMEHRAADFSRELESLERERPHDPVVRLFAGDRAFDAYRRGGGAASLAAAATAYRKAVESDDAFPEAHARLGFLLDFGGDLPAAERAWRKAVALLEGHAALGAKYRNGLAGVLAQQGRSEDALRLYDGDPEYARSGIDGAMLRWQAGASVDALGQARDRLERLRLQLAGNGAAEAWGFKAGGDIVLFGRIEAQRCLAELALAATGHLLGRNEAAGSAGLLDTGDCRLVRSDVTLLVCHQLARAAAVGNARAEGTRDWLRCPVPKRERVLRPEERSATWRTDT